ncbi:hypothetical protein TNCV_4274831 [Trichonephila clavipes]|nr:hypothetical protein TNCV_4274831 [Trichonephila clavipes]
MEKGQEETKKGQDLKNSLEKKIYTVEEKINSVKEKIALKECNEGNQDCPCCSSTCAFFCSASHYLTSVSKTVYLWRKNQLAREYTRLNSQLFLKPMDGLKG